MAAVLTVPVLVATLALVDHGFPLARLDLDDGAVWLTATDRLMIGRYNVPVEELNAGLAADGAAFDVLQDGGDVLLAQPGGVAVVDPATVTAGTPVAAAGLTVSMAAGTVALTAGDGSVWVRTLEGLGSLVPASDTPDAELGAGGRALVARTGVVLAVSAAGGAVTRLDPATGARGFGTVGGGAIDQLTAVGDEPVVLSGSTLRTRYGAVELDGEDLVLQQAGPAANRVLVASRTALLEVPLSGGAAVVHPTGGSGMPTAPVQVGGCAHGAWAAAAGNYLQLCDGSTARVESLAAVATSTTLVFRVNRSMVVLNDTAAGRMWLPSKDTQVRLPDWQQVAIEPEPDPDPDPNPEQGSTTQDVSAECSADSRPPTAVDDDFGVRAGRTSVLAVLDNDSSSDCGILAISEFEPPPAAFAVVEPVYGRRALQVRVATGAEGSTTFSYTIIDGRGTTPPSTATVTLTVHPDGRDGAPTQMRVPTVSVDAGGQVTVDVLAAFVDPDGDDLLLVGASADPAVGTVAWRQDGHLTFTADGGSLGRTGLAVQVSDGTLTSEGEVVVDVRAAGTVPPQIDPVHAVTYVDQPVTVSPLDYVRSSSSEPVRLATVDDVVGASIEPDLIAGTFTFTARQAGTYYVPFVVTAAPAQASGVARIDVRPWLATAVPPVAVRDRAFLAAGGQATVDPLANDEDATGSVLVVQGVDVPDGYGLKVAVLDHHLVQLWAERALPEPVVLSYTVSNGVASAVGQIVVTPVPVWLTSQPPVVRDVEAGVRAGGVVTVPVLETAYDPDGDALTLASDLSQPLPPGDGLLFVSGDVLRYQAPNRAMTARATFEVADSTGRVTSARLTVRVHGAAAAAKAPPVPLDLVARVYAGDTVRIDVPLVGIDVDGDGVTLLGLASAPLKGVVTVGADHLGYAALPGEVGTDTFTYAVEDWTGQRAVATVRVGIAARPTGAATVVARDDAVIVRPDDIVEVRVLDNDIDSSGGLLTLEPTLEAPAGVLATADVVSGRVNLTAPHAEGVVQIAYSVRNARGGRDTAVLTITVLATAPVLAPIARDVVVPAADTFGRSSVIVDVLAVAQNPSGPLRDLDVSVPESAAATVRVVGGEVVVTLAATMQTVPYLLTNSRSPDARAYAFITVPALGNFPPMLRPGLDALTVASGQQLVIPLDERIKVAPGRRPSVADVAQVSATRSDGGSLVRDARTVTFTSAGGYAGPASVTVLVTDSTGPGDAYARTTLITLPVTVFAVDDHPPTFAASQVRAGPGESPVTVDMLAFLTGADGQPGREGDYTFRMTTAVPNGFVVVLTGSTITVSTLAQTVKGTAGRLTLAIGYGRAGTLEANVDLVVTASTRARARVPDRRVEDGVQGQLTTVDVLAGAFNPYPDAGPLTVVGATVETPGSGTAAVVDGRVVVRPAADMVGEMAVRARVRDATGDPDREVDARIVVVVSGVPAQPAAPRVVEVRDRAAVLSWSAPDPRGRPVIDYQVFAAPGGLVRTCSGTTCTVDGLTNDVEYTFTVAARNAVGPSTPSAPSAPARPDAQPAAPSGLSLDFADGALLATWAAPQVTGSPVTSYTVQVTPRTQAGASTFTAMTTSARIENLANGTAYTVQVQARNRAPDPSAWSESATATPARAPDAPAPDASRREGGAAGNVIDVTWPALTGAASGGDAVWRYEVSVDGGAPVGVGPAASYQLRDVERRTYAIRVRGVNKAGGGAWGAVTGEVWSAPRAPTGLQAQPSTPLDDRGWGDGEVRLSWSAPDDAGGAGVQITGYEVVLEGGAITAVSGTSTTATGLAGGSSPTLRVRSVSSRDLRSDWASIRSGTVVTRPAAAGVTVRAAGVDQVSIGVVLGDWGGASPGAREVTYRIDAGPWTNAAQTAVPGTYTRPGGGVVIVEVRQRNTDGGSASLGSGQGTTGEPSAPGAPVGVTALPDVGGTAIVVAWSAPASDGGRPVDRYEWRIRLDAGAETALESAETDAAALTATTEAAYAAGSAYVVDVRAHTTAGTWGAWSAPVTVTVTLSPG